MLQQILQFIADPQNSFRSETVATLELSFIPVIAAIVIACPLGILVAQRPLPAFLAANTSGLVRAIPTLAILAAALPYLGTGFVPSAIALTVLGIPPILLNTVAGTRSIDPAVIDAARGMGMTGWQLLVRVRLPLILPVMAAGVRTAAVQIVATVPLAALIGGGGYGDYILQGVNLLSMPPLIVGSAGIAILAVGVELGLAAIQRFAGPRYLRAGTDAQATNDEESAHAEIMAPVA